MNAPSGVSTAVAQLPALVTIGGFTVAGPSRRFDAASKSEIPRLWPVLIDALPLHGQLPGDANYGVVWNADRADGSFQYMAGVRIEPGSELPNGFDALDVPAASYVVFRITLSGAAIHPQLQQAMATIWGESIPDSGLEPVDGPVFELYDGRFAPNRAGAVIDFHVPVAV